MKREMTLCEGEGCKKKQSCKRHTSIDEVKRNMVIGTPWMAHCYCRNTEFMEAKYPFLVPNTE